VPAALQDRGGWANRDSPGWFAEYASIVFERLGDRAGHWLTICEPATLATVGYLLGLMAPATRDLHASLRVGHHLLLGHGLAVQAYRASGASGAIGTSTGLAPCLPASERDDDRAAADRANLFHNATYLDPVLLGRYPDEVVSAHGAAWPEVRDGDLAVISSPVDFVGITYYGGQYVAAATDADGSDAGDAGEVPPHLVQMKAVAEYGERLTGARPLPPGGPSTDSSFPIAPDFLRAGLRWLKARYGNPPVIVTENGAAFDDVVDDAGRVDDERREDYLRQHLLAAHAAIEEDGVDLRGWMVWSFLDTWEFFAGHGWPFGLVHVDRGTLARTVKRSGRWYAGVMAQNAV
jgi:beta-glucosidase